jgi:hypothetical protein
MFARIRRKETLLPWALTVGLLTLQPAVTRAEPVKITTGNWHIAKPSKDYKDLPTLLTKDQIESPSPIGLIEFVCLKSSYFILLVQPEVKLRDSELGAIAAKTGSGGSSAPSPVTFNNLYKSKSVLSRSLDWDADIHYAELGSALLASIKAAAELELTLAGRSFVVDVSDLGARFGSFQLFCEKGIVDEAKHFEGR